MQGYPPPEIRWQKVLMVRGRRKEVPVIEERPRLSIDTFQLSSTAAMSQLIIRDQFDKTFYKGTIPGLFSIKFVLFKQTIPSIIATN